MKTTATTIEWLRKALAEDAPRDFVTVSAPIVRNLLDDFAELQAQLAEAREVVTQLTESHEHNLFGTCAACNECEPCGYQAALLFLESTAALEPVKK